jgi:hypothetical protein
MENLTNIMYLYLLIHQGYFEKVNYSKISKELGVTRQTLSKQYNSLLDKEMIIRDDFGFIRVKEVLEFDEEDLEFVRNKITDYPSSYIGYLLLKRRLLNQTDASICNMLKISEKFIKNYQQKIIFDKKSNEEENEVVNYIYAIILNKEIKYVGSTSDLVNRIQTHCNKRRFLTENNFIILEKCSRKNRFDRESFYRKLFNPEWNTII